MQQNNYQKEQPESKNKLGGGTMEDKIQGKEW